MAQRFTLAAILSLSLPIFAFAQTERSWLRPFAPKAAPAKTAAVDPKRQAEIAVELAWLADPVTFPYYLEAKADGNTLRIKGYVPNSTVREHVVRLARVHSTLSVTDAVKEHPSLLVRPALMAPAQLQSTVASSLREALPKQAAALKVQCAADGSVTVRGPLKTAEEKLMVSHALRRLHGLTSVQNLTQVAGEPEPGRTVAAIPTSEPKQVPRPWWGLPFMKKETKEKEPAKAPAVAKAPAPEAPSLPKPPPIVTAQEPVPKLEGPRLSLPDEKKPPTLEVPKVVVEAPPAPKEPLKSEPPAPPPAKEPPPTPKAAPDSASAMQFQKLIEEKCSGVRDVKVAFKTPTELRVELTVRNDEQITTFAGIILSLPELADYRDRLDLQFKLEP